MSHGTLVHINHLVIEFDLCTREEMQHHWSISKRLARVDSVAYIRFSNQANYDISELNADCSNIWERDSKIFWKFSLFLVIVILSTPNFNRVNIPMSSGLRLIEQIGSTRDGIHALNDSNSHHRQLCQNEATSSRNSTGFEVFQVWTERCWQQWMCKPLLRARAYL